MGLEGQMSLRLVSTLFSPLLRCGVSETGPITTKSITLAPGYNEPSCNESLAIRNSTSQPCY